MFMIFDSIANALEHLCCVDNWEWEGSSSYDGLCEWAYENAREETYLSECENPKPESYKILSLPLQSCHDQIQINHLSVATEGVVPVLVDMVPYPVGERSF